MIGQLIGKKLPLVVYVLTLGTFLMATTEFVVAGLLPEIATDLNISVGQAGLSITVFAIGMIVGAPLMSMLTLRLPPRATLSLALATFVFGHVVVAMASSFPVILVARFVTALATGAFWAVANIVASRAAGPSANSRALGVVGAGGMLASVVGVPAGAVAGQVVGWRGPFWVLAALSIAAAGLIMHTVDHSRPEPGSVSIRSELAGMRSLRLWLALAACATVTGGVLSTYSYISPLLTDRTGLPTGVVPLILVGFGIGALGGSLLGGRAGDRRPHVTTIVAAAASTVILAAVCVLAGSAVPTLVLLVLLGLVGLGANPVLIALSVHYAGTASTLGSSLSISAFNLGTAVGSGVAGLSLGTALGVTGPAVVGTVIVSRTLIPVITLAVLARRFGCGRLRSAAPHHPPQAESTETRESTR